MIRLGNGWSPSDVAGARLIDDDTVRNHFKRYKRGGITALERMNYAGSEALLTSAQLAELDAHLQQQLHPTAASVARWVEERFEVHYTDSGMTTRLHRLGYRFKAVRAYLEHSRIDLQFLPFYAPNLNLIERFWKCFKRQILYQRYYETFANHKTACNQFFADLDVHAQRFRSLLTENFEIIRDY